MAVRPTQLAAKKSPVGPIIVVVVVVAAAAVGGWYFFLRPGPERVVKAYLHASETGDTAAMKAMLSADTVKLVSMGGESESAKALKMSVPTGLTYTVGQTKIEGDKATVFVKYASGGGAGGPSAARGQGVPFVLVKEDGRWKIDLMSTILMQGLSNAASDLATGIGDAMRGAVRRRR